MVCILLDCNCSDFLSSKYCFARIKPEKGIVHTRFLRNRQTIEQSYICFILRNIQVHLSFDLQITNKKEGLVIKIKNGKIEGTNLIRRRKVVKLHLQPGFSSGHQERGVLEKTVAKKNNKIAPLVLQQLLDGQPPLPGRCLHPAQAMEMSSNVIQRTTLPRPVPQYQFHPHPSMSPVPFTINEFRSKIQKNSPLAGGSSRDVTT